MRFINSNAVEFEPIHVDNNVFTFADQIDGIGTQASHNDNSAQYESTSAIDTTTGTYDRTANGGLLVENKDGDFKSTRPYSEHIAEHLNVDLQTVESSTYTTLHPGRQFTGTTGSAGLTHVVPLSDSPRVIIFGSMKVTPSSLNPIVRNRLIVGQLIVKSGITNKEEALEVIFKKSGIKKGKAVYTDQDNIDAHAKMNEVIEENKEMFKSTWEEYRFFEQGIFETNEPKKKLEFDDFVKKVKKPC